MGRPIGIAAAALLAQLLLLAAAAADAAVGLTTEGVVDVNLHQHNLQHGHQQQRRHRRARRLMQPDVQLDAAQAGAKPVQQEVLVSALTAIHNARKCPPLLRCLISTQRLT